MHAVIWISVVYKLYGSGWGGVEGALIDSLVSHQYVQVVAVVILLRHSQRQHLLVQKQSTQTLLASLPLLFQLPLPEGFLLKLTLLWSFLIDRERERGWRWYLDEDQGCLRLLASLTCSVKGWVNRNGCLSMWYLSHLKNFGQHNVTCQPGSDIVGYRGKWNGICQVQ